ncbi:hypothetical protein [Clostridium polynesiense]|uniref:hypothetical protein n=1 Tax=Clostridium polynesiense TaxID=1325933 RepID=UPI000693E5BA|nr:hypothetical protein [Clostridium polynesiense]
MQYKKYLPIIIGLFLFSGILYKRQASGVIRIVDKSDSAIVVNDNKDSIQVSPSDKIVKDALNELNKIETNKEASEYSYASHEDEQASSSMPKMSRGGSSNYSPYSSKYGEKLDWWKEVNSLIPIGAVLQIRDLYTDKTFNVKRTFGTKHADVEPLTLQDTNIIKSIWGEFSWERRPVVVYYSGKSIAASLSAMPHAGVDSEPSEDIIENRSGEYGKGANLDSVKDNGMDGVIDLHFFNSRTHGSDKLDEEHQNAVLKASGQ